MPVLPIVRCQSFEQAVEDAVVAEHGNRHTASIFSKDVDHMTRFARVIETTIYVKNSATKAGVGHWRRGPLHHDHCRPHRRGHHLRKEFLPPPPLHAGRGRAAHHLSF